MKNTYIMAVISKISVVIMTLITSAFINRLLGAELKGEYAYINNIVSILVIILSLGIGQTYSAYRRKYGKECLNTFIALTIIQALVTFIFSLVAVMLKMNNVICMSLFLSTFSILRNNIMYIAAIEDVKKRDKNNIFYKFIYTVLVGVVYILNIKLINVFFALMVIDECITVIGTIYLYKFKPDFQFIKKNKLKINRIYYMGLQSMLMLMLINLNYNLDIIFLKQLKTSREVGVYSIAVALANMFWLIPDAFKDVMFNKTAKEDSVIEIVKLTKFTLYLSMIIIIGYILFGRIFIQILYGMEYIESYGVTAILFIGCLSMIIYKLIHPLYISKGKQKVVVIILSISVTINIIANYILIPKFSMYGAAYASIASYSVCGIIFLKIFCKEYNVKIKDFFIIEQEDIEMIKNRLKKKKVGEQK